MIVRTKLAVACGLTVVSTVAPVLVAGLILTGRAGAVTAAFAVGALAASMAYCAVLVLVHVLTWHAVVVGLLYVLVWESLIGGFVPGAQAVSVQQWALSIVNWLTPDHPLPADLAPGIAVVLLLAVAAAATGYAGQRLRSFNISGEA